MAICEKCGHSNDDNVKFCGGCGARMDVRSSTPPPHVFDTKPDEDTPKQPKRDLYLHPTSHVPPHSRQSPSQRRNMLSPVAIQALCRSRACTRAAWFCWLSFLSVGEFLPTWCTKMTKKKAEVS